MTRFLDKVFGTKKTSTQLRTRRDFRPKVENLEGRVMMTRQAILDFDGETLTPTEMQQGGWTNNADGSAITGNVTVPCFRDLFTSARPGLDFNSDGVVNATDADAAITAIVAKVRQHFAPYDLKITVGDQDTHQAKLTDSQVGDVLVIITGGTDTITGVSGSAGVTPWADLGNEHDEISWVFGQVLADNLPLDQFISNTAQVISHEMGHAFGLEHIHFEQFLPDGQFNRVPTHHIMGQSYGVSRNFQDLTYDIDTEGRLESVLHPEFNTETQNAHQYLSNPAVLGPSKGSWVAVLKPGQLTISGDDNDNNISVRSFTTNQWLIMSSSSFRPPGSSKTVTFTTETLMAVSNPVATHDRNSLNPFSTPLDSVVVYAKGGLDTVALNSSIIFAATYVYGGAGNDTIYGGNGINVLYGEGGRDKLHGAGMTDFLFGGLEADELYGYGGLDYLDGGDDLAQDILRGGTGTDTYIQYTNIYSIYTRWDTIEDQDNDSIVTTKRSKFYT